MVPSRQPDSSAGGQLALNPAARATDGGGDGERWRLGDSQRAALTREVRRECVVIEHAEYGAAVIRDQKPINEASLASALVDMTVPAWLKVLNSRSFFFLQRERLLTLHNARSYSTRAHPVITVDTASLLGEYESRLGEQRLRHRLRAAAQQGRAWARHVPFDRSVRAPRP